MGTEERFDFVIIGGGPNGVTLAAYLAKCGASVCVLEERPEAGGAYENTEPIPGALTRTPCCSMLEQLLALSNWNYGSTAGG